MGKLMRDIIWKLGLYSNMFIMYIYYMFKRKK